MATVEQHECAWPDCRTLVPSNWMFCRGRLCQSRRLRAQLGETTANQRALLAQRDRRRKDQTREWNASAYASRRGRLQTIRRDHEHRMEAIATANHQYRTAMYRSAVDTASRELLALIEDQQREDRAHLRRGKGDPWGIVSLDAPIPGADDVTIGDLIAYNEDANGTPWMDPTGDMVLALCDRASEIDAWDFVQEIAPRDVRLPLEGYATAAEGPAHADHAEGPHDPGADTQGRAR